MIPKRRRYMRGSFELSTHAVAVLPGVLDLPTRLIAAAPLRTLARHERSLADCLP